MINRRQILQVLSVMPFFGVTKSKYHAVLVINYWPFAEQICQITNDYVNRRSIVSDELNPLLVANASVLENGDLSVTMYDSKIMKLSVEHDIESMRYVVVLKNWAVEQFNEFGYKTRTITKDDYLTCKSCLF